MTPPETAEALIGLIDERTEVAPYVRTVTSPDGGEDEQSGNPGAEFEHAHMDSVFALNQRVRQAREDWDASRAEAASDKKRYDALVEDLSDLIAQGPSRMPLFGPLSVDAPAADDTDAPTEPESPWRDMQLVGLTCPALKPATLKALLENSPPLTTMGKLADWQGIKGDFWAKDIPGIGDKGQAEIEDFQMAHIPMADEPDPEPAESDETWTAEEAEELATIQKGCKSAALRSIELCVSLKVLKAAEEDLKGDWRCWAVTGRIAELEPAYTE